MYAHTQAFIDISVKCVNVMNQPDIPELKDTGVPLGLIATEEQARQQTTS